MRFLKKVKQKIFESVLTKSTNCDKIQITAIYKVKNRKTMTIA